MERFSLVSISSSDKQSSKIVHNFKPLKHYTSFILLSLKKKKATKQQKKHPKNKIKLTNSFEYKWKKYEHCNSILVINVYLF